MIKIIVAMEPRGYIGKNNEIPWIIKEDMKFFKETTIDNFIIMGRKTWDSLNRKPLPRRHSIVITRNRHEYQQQDHERTYFVKSLNDAIQLCQDINNGNGFIIGGEQIYRQSLCRSKVAAAIVSHIKKEYDGDSIFPISLIEKYPKTLIVDFNDFTVYEYDLTGLR